MSESEGAESQENKRTIATSGHASGTSTATAMATAIANVDARLTPSEAEAESRWESLKEMFLPVLLRKIVSSVMFWGALAGCLVYPKWKFDPVWLIAVVAMAAVIRQPRIEIVKIETKDLPVRQAFSEEISERRNARWKAAPFWFRVSAIACGFIFACGVTVFIAIKADAYLTAVNEAVRAGKPLTVEWKLIAAMLASVTAGPMLVVVAIVKSFRTTPDQDKDFDQAAAAASVAKNVTQSTD